MSLGIQRTCYQQNSIQLNSTQQNRNLNGNQKQLSTNYQNQQLGFGAFSTKAYSGHSEIAELLLKAVEVIKNLPHKTDIKKERLRGSVQFTIAAENPEIEKQIMTSFQDRGIECTKIEEKVQPEACDLLAELANIGKTDTAAPQTSTSSLNGIGEGGNSHPKIIL